MGYESQLLSCICFSIFCYIGVQGQSALEDGTDEMNPNILTQMGKQQNILGSPPEIQARLDTIETKPGQNETPTATYWRPGGMYDILNGTQNVVGISYDLSNLTMGNHLVSGGYMFTNTYAPYKPYPADIPPNCRTIHADVVNKPFNTLSAGGDPWCQIGFMAPCNAECAATHVKRDYFHYVATVGYPREYTTKRLISYDGGSFYTTNHIFPYDDLYCHANRWDSLNPSVSASYDLWHQKAAMECAKLSQEFPTLHTWTAQELSQTTKAEIQMLKMHMDGKGAAPTSFMMRRHAAFKCGLGDVGCDMAYCAANFCMLKGKRGPVMGHREQCPGGMQKMLDKGKQFAISVDVDGEPRVLEVS